MQQARSKKMDRGLMMNSAWTAIVQFKVLLLRPFAHRSYNP